jgi:hypothetical protein
VINTGNDPLNVTDIVLTSLFGVDSCVFTVAPGGNQEVSVSFTPNGADTFEELLIVHSDDPNNPTVDVTVRGTGVVAGDLAGGGDGVNVLDIIALIKIIFGTSPAPQPGTAFFQAADVNGDGNIDVLDIVKLVNIILNPPQVKAVVVDLSEPAYMSLGVMQVVEHRPLIWDTFYSTKIDMEDQVEYPLNRLHEMSRNELKSVYDAFFYRIDW